MFTSAAVMAIPAALAAGDTARKKVAADAIASTGRRCRMSTTSLIVFPG